ncbi:MAG: hypothetical protein J7J91_08535, partial [Deltaproteobacteria bacterium]|nr:hypothetical protein [Deltaproteobacteria bacterium]
MLCVGTDTFGRSASWRAAIGGRPHAERRDEGEEKTALRSSNQIHSVTISVIVKDEYPGYCFFST